MSVSVPSGGDDVAAELTTDRLVLRPVTAQPVEAILGGNRLPDWASDFPDEGDVVIARMLSTNGLPAGPARFGQRQLVERSSGLVVGGVGFFGPPKHGWVEIGYGVVPSRRSRGYATEAVHAMIDFAFRQDGVRSVRAGVELSNPASVRVLEKVGMTLVRRTADLADFAVEAGSMSPPVTQASAAVHLAATGTPPPATRVASYP